MRVELKQWTQKDRADLVRISNSADRSYLSNRLPYPYTEKNGDWWLNMVSQNEGKDGIFRAVTADGKIVGNISVERKSDVYEKDGEIGYLLAEEFRGRGIMSRAVELVCPIAFEQLGLARITGMVYEPNGASRKVLEKNGFVLEGIMKQAVWKNEKLYDLLVYGKYKGS